MPFRRWIEVELHHVDLGIGYELEDLPEEFTEREIDFLADRFAGHPEVPPTRAVTDGTRAWSTGSATTADRRRAHRGDRDRPRAPSCSAGSRAAATGAALTSRRAARLPAAPPALG